MRPDARRRPGFTAPEADASRHSGYTAWLVLLSDEALTALIPAHDRTAESALAGLYERYSSSVYGLAQRLLGDAGLAENVLQETFWRLWLHAGQYQAGRVRFGTWLLRIARNLALSELRQAACRPRLSAAQPASERPDGWEGGAEFRDPEADVPEQVWQAEQRRIVRAGLAILPAEQRQVVELAYFGGLTHREIAAVQSAPPSTVKTRLALGLQKLSHHLSAHGLSREAA